ncbi:WxL domain-containing protein [Enterococcus mundtii]|uniref:WxL domain-containing protein n=1 Tax=Enterococcus mundtii TaxID=53346 RepID=UPI000DFBB3C3|nr:WxL domain-containing protein [Enterococcus mundtii]STD22020.1 membrane associated lipoprotein [Enterococcus mundtii]
MKKHIALFGTTLLLGSLLGGTGVLAQEKTQTEANPKTATTSVTGQLQLSEDGGFNPNVPSPSLNEKTNVPEDSYFGIAYKPSTFNIGNVALADTNTDQFIVMQGQSSDVTKADNNGEAFHVAVKDKRRTDNGNWALKVKLDSEIEEDLGISIKTNTLADSVKRNINNGSEDFTSGHLIEQVKKDGTNKEVTNVAGLTITTTDSNVMETVNGKFVNGVYDLKLPQVELHIPDASKVKAQQLDTNVTWTLTNAAE